MGICVRVRFEVFWDSKKACPMHKSVSKRKALRGYLWVRLSNHHFIVRMMDELDWYA